MHRSANRRAVRQWALLFWGGLGLFCLQSRPAWAQDFDEADSSVHRNAFVRAAHDLKRDSDLEGRQALDGRMRLENRVRFGQSGVLVALDGEARYETFDARYAGEESFTLLEAYAEFRRDAFNIGLGRQIVTWGKLDDMMILDQLSPQDYRWFAFYTKQERKLPVFMLTSGFYGPRYSIEGVFIPVFVPSEVDYFGNDWALFGHLKDQVAGAGYPAEVKQMVAAIDVDDRATRGKAEGGFRLRATEGSTDYALYYMTYYHRLPSLQAVTPAGRLTKQFLLAPGPETLTALAGAHPGLRDLTLDAGYERVHAIGVDFETVAGAYGLRGEAGFFSELPYTRITDLSTVRKKALAAGLGVDYTTFNNLYWNVQVVANKILNDEAVIEAEAFSQEIALNMNKDFMMGYMQLDFSGIYQITDGGWLLRPEMTYKARPGLDVVCGLVLLGGSDTSMFGRVKHKDLIYTQLRYRF